MSLSRGRLRLLLVLTAAPSCSSEPAAPVDHNCDALAADQRATTPRGACPNDLPSESGCGTAIPSYKTDVAAVFAARCGTCHAPGGIEAALPLTTHAQIFAQRRTVLNQIFSCLMPSPCATDLSADERANVLKWMVCGSPDN